MEIESLSQKLVEASTNVDGNFHGSRLKNINSVDDRAGHIVSLFDLLPWEFSIISMKFQWSKFPSLGSKCTSMEVDGSRFTSMEISVELVDLDYLHGS